MIRSINRQGFHDGFGQGRLDCFNNSDQSARYAGAAQSHMSAYVRGYAMGYLAAIEEYKAKP